VSTTSIPPADLAGPSSIPPADLAGPSLWRRLFRAKQYDTVSYLTVYLVLLLFIPSSLIFAPLGGSGTPAVVYSLLLLLLFIASWMVGRVTPSGAGRPIRIAILIFTLAVLASFVAGMTRDSAQSEVLSAGRGLITVTAWAGLIVVVSQTVTSYDRIETLLRRAVIFGSIVAAIGILEFYTALNVTNYIQIPGLSNNIDFSTLMVRSGLNRPSSTAVDPIEFGVVMSMLLPIALHQAVTGSFPGKIRKWLPVVLIAFAIPISVSRSGLLTAAVGCVVLVVTWPPRQRRGFLVASLIGLGALKAAAPGLLGTLFNYFTEMFGSSNSAGSVTSRTDDYARNWQYIVQRPFFGRGFETFLPEIYSWTDNMYLKILIETGIVGLASLLLLYLAGIHCAAAGRRVAQDEARRSLGQAMVAAISVAFVATATFDSIDFPMFAGVLFLILGLAGAYLGIMRRESDSLPMPHVMATINSAKPE
jgi:polysaccharide biosynthesis protein PslJ